MAVYNNWETVIHEGLVFHVSGKYKVERFAHVINPKTKEIASIKLGYDKEQNYICCEIDHITNPNILFHTNRFKAVLKIKEILQDPKVPCVGKYMEAVKGKNKNKRGLVVTLTKDWAWLQYHMSSHPFRVHRTHLVTTKAPDRLNHIPPTFQENIWNIASDYAAEHDIILYFQLVDLYLRQ